MPRFDIFAAAPHCRHVAIDAADAAATLLMMPVTFAFF